MPPPALREVSTTMTPNTPRRRMILDVDERGRVSIGKLGFRSMQVVADSTDDGGLILQEAIALSPAEVAHYQNPRAVELLDQAITSADEGRLREFRLRSEESPNLAE